MNEFSRAPPRLLAQAGIAATVLLLISCASTPAPTSTLQAAQQAITSAERADAGRYAAAELSEARTRLLSANDAVRDENMIAARRFGEQARAAAELAAARSDTAKALQVNDEMKRANEALLEETQRNSGVSR